MEDRRSGARRLSPISNLLSPKAVARQPVKTREQTRFISGPRVVVNSQQRSYHCMWQRFGLASSVHFPSAADWGQSALRPGPRVVLNSQQRSYHCMWQWFGLASSVHFPPAADWGQSALRPGPRVVLNSQQQLRSSKVHFLYIARGSLSETQYFVHLACRLGYLADAEASELHAHTRRVFEMPSWSDSVGGSRDGQDQQSRRRCHESARPGLSALAFWSGGPVVRGLVVSVPCPWSCGQWFRCCTVPSSGQSSRFLTAPFNSEREP